VALLAPAAERWVTADAPLDSDRIALLAQLSRGYFFREEHARAIAIADRALAAAERLDAVELVADLLVTRGSALGNLGRLYEGLGAIRAAMELADAHDLTATSLRARVNLTAFGGGDPAATYPVAREALATAVRLGRLGLARSLRGNATSNAVDVGDWDWAVEQWTAELETTTDDFARTFARWSLVSLGAGRGDDVAAEFAELADWAREYGDPGVLTGLEALRGEVAAGEGRLIDAYDALLRAAGGDALNAPAFTSLAGRLVLIAGDRPRAERALAALEATHIHGRLWGLDGQLLRAGIGALTGAAGADLQAFREAIEGYREAGVPPRIVYAVLVLLATRGGDEPDVGALVEEAEGIARRLGAKPLQRELARLRPASTGGSPRRGAATSGVASEGQAGNVAVPTGESRPD
jgi:tetratricopeptide (TPR) repeat protein